ncbi:MULTISPECIES: YihY/virulence factor BrkB family protein [unclassified Microbacterium]|uniref:YihY/virulence factor BrkB family protein n=1 Tax=unclassified Microbacterium TaxID=2609290 RepID=UPI0009EC8D1A|nr:MULTISPECIES: YihY/virulence factor BrkB family protein [unclassified Microbacterium]MBD8206500.1 YihY/virulence factor BrkB family protein [Microbacterium sp. CFBP 8801]MBD8508305.1 YihY/virulence factor BrkB family protein [Microbacterium sp. CFBP 8790]
MTETHSDPRPLPAVREDDTSLRDRLEAAQSAVRSRLDQPIARAARIARWFPIRVWRHFLQHNGFLLAAGMSYQGIFAVFSALYLAFAGVGIWLGGSKSAIDGLIGIINSYIPGIISKNGLVDREQVESVAQESGRLLTITGIVAVVVVVWTAIGFVTFTRRAVRDTFGLPFDMRNYVLLKARDFVASILFGLALLVGALLGSVTTGAVDLVFGFIGWDRETLGWSVGARVVSLLVAFAVNTVALAALFRFLTGTTLTWRRAWPGALVGATGMVLLQVGAGFLVVYSPTNPLLGTFAVLIGFLLWFRLIGIVILVSAAWIAVAAGDRDVPLRSPEDRRAMEQAALVIAAQVGVREAEKTLALTRWPWRWRAKRALSAAEKTLARAEADVPAPRRMSLIPD